MKGAEKNSVVECNVSMAITTPTWMFKSTEQMPPSAAVPSKSTLENSVFWLSSRNEISFCDLKDTSSLHQK